MTTILVLVKGNTTATVELTPKDTASTAATRAYTDTFGPTQGRLFSLKADAEALNPDAKIPDATTYELIELEILGTPLRSADLETAETLDAALNPDA